MTELIGDIVINCSGGAALAAGTAIPTANITVSLATNVTSRILNNLGGSGSEALLLIDEPGTALASAIAGFGPSAPQTLCTSATVGAGPGGCVEYAQTMGGIPVATQSATVPSTGNVPGWNVFEGIVSANQVTFFGVPILAPGTSGANRVYRMTNIRANVNGLGGGGLAGTTQLLASISFSGSTSLPVNNPVQIAGFVQTGLNTTLRNANNTGGLSSSGAGFNQCSTQTTSAVAILQYAETFGTAFKTRVDATRVGATYSGQTGSGAVQNIPGSIYNSESGFILNAASSGGFIAGLADYGTRLKATFNNVPAGVSLFVSITNLAANTTSANTAAPANNSTTSYAALINGEASPDANGFAPVLSATTTVNSGATGIYQVPLTGGSGVAVWEIINTNPSTTETLNFGVWTSYTANPGSNSPAPGTGTASLAFAPTPTVPFSASAGAAASSTLTVPRFADTSTAKNLIVINVCTTNLLFPFLTNLSGSGFDTGIAIANTSTDPFGTSPQSGACVLNWYQGATNPPTTNTGSIASGTVYTTLVSSAAPGFSGYMIAQCNFQYAHGFAFISDIGARNIAMGYLALVINGTRNQSTAENLSH